VKGIRFYEELTDKGCKAEKSNGTVIAVFYKQYWHGEHDLLFQAVSGLFSEPNTPVCGSSVSQSYLADHCRRVSEARAREIHPKLFEYLERGQSYEP